MLTAKIILGILGAGYFIWNIVATARFLWSIRRQKNSFKAYLVMATVGILFALPIWGIMWAFGMWLESIDKEEAQELENGEYAYPEGAERRS